jgi:hypothetical protein
MTLLLERAHGSREKDFGRKPAMNLAKREGEGKGKKEAEGAGSTGQITLDSDSILANMQNRVPELSLSFPPVEPKSPEVNMRGT